MTSRVLASGKSRINKTIVRERDRKKTYDLFILFVLLVLVSVPGLLYLRNRIEYVRYQYKITELKHQKKILLTNEKYLETEKALLESPRRLEEQARGRFLLSPQNEGGPLIVVRLRQIKKKGPYLLTEKKHVSGMEEMFLRSGTLRED